MMALRDLAHPWDEWFAQLKPSKKNLKQEEYPTLLIRRGEDYNCLTHSMMMQLRRQGRTRNLKLRCQVREDGEAIEIMLAKTN